MVRSSIRASAGPCPPPGRDEKDHCHGDDIIGDNDLAEFTASGGMVVTGTNSVGLNNQQKQLGFHTTDDIMLDMDMRGDLRRRRRRRRRFLRRWGEPRPER